MSDPLVIHVEQIGNIDYGDILLDMPIELGDELNTMDYMDTMHKKHYMNPKIKIK